MVLCPSGRQAGTDLYQAFGSPVPVSVNDTPARRQDGEIGMAIQMEALRTVDAPSLAPDDRPIDLVHLARTTLGDRSLEREVLQLFDRQSTLLIARMRTAAPAGIANLAHTMKGSALGIGAWRVARAAEALELAGGADDLAGALDRLAAASDEACALIAELLRAN